MTRYWYYYYDYYYERICLLAQHAESSTDHLGLSRACLDLDYRHAKTGSQSPLGQRCLTHPIHRCRGHVALLSIEKQKPHSDVFILKVPKSFFIPEKKWFFKEEEKKKKKNPDSFPDSDPSKLSLWQRLFRQKESTLLRPPKVLTDVIFEEVRIPWINHVHVFSIRNKVWVSFFTLRKLKACGVRCGSRRGML